MSARFCPRYRISPVAAGAIGHLGQCPTSKFQRKVKKNPRGGVHHNMLRVRGYVPPIWVGFWAPNSLNKGPFFGRFSLNKGGLSRNRRKI